MKPGSSRSRYRRAGLIAGLAVLIGGLLAGAGLAGNAIRRPPEPGEPGERAADRDILERSFNYQGYLEDGGVPVDGNRDMIFRIYADMCFSLVSEYVQAGVPIRDGVFSVQIPVTGAVFYGEGRWLQVVVEGTALACMPITAVPYALSLRPGAAIGGEQEDWDGLHVENTATAGRSYGIYAQTDSPDGYGVYALGVDAGVDVVLAGNANTTAGDDGVLASDPAFPSSDLVFLSNDGYRLELDNDGDGEDADFEIRNPANDLLFNVDESGAVGMGGSGLVAFPRPAYNSGFVTVGQGAQITLTHNLGGTAANYVVVMDFNRTGSGYGNNIFGLGGDQDSGDYYGAYWTNLTNSQIIIHRQTNDEDCPQIRVRIWIYPD